MHYRDLLEIGPCLVFNTLLPTCPLVSLSIFIIHDGDLSLQHAFIHAV
jgi:hypothetical protein